MLLQLDLITTVVYCFFIMLCVKTLDKNNLIFFPSVDAVNTISDFWTAIQAAESLC